MGKFDQRAEEFGLLVGLHDSARRVEDLPLDWIMADPGNPRRVFDEKELDDLAASIAARGVLQPIIVAPKNRSEEHTSEIQSLMRISYAVFCLKNKNQHHTLTHSHFLFINLIYLYSALDNININISNLISN